MGRPKGSKNKKKADKAKNPLKTAIQELMASSDPKDKASGVRLRMAFDKLYGKKKTAVVDPTVLAFVEMIARLEQELKIAGVDIIGIIGQQNSGVEQLIRQEVSAMRDADGSDAV